MTKRSNPKQKRNAKLTSMKLPDTVRSQAAIVGEGDMTKGVERLFAQLPTFYRVKLLLELMSMDTAVPQQWRDRIEAELPELEALGIDRIHEEAIAEGVIKLPEGSWIV